MSPPYAPTQVFSSSVHSYAFRLPPGADLRAKLENIVKRHQLAAAAILTCVGSLSAACIRLADESLPHAYPGLFEIVSLSGTCGPNGAHMHVPFADAGGAVRGGHLRHGSIILTTAEIVIAHLPALRFARAMDAATGFAELQVGPA